MEATTNEWSRPTTLRRDCRIQDGGGHHARSRKSARRRLHAMGRVYAIPCARDGPRDGFEELEGGVVFVSRRRHGVYERDVDDLVHEQVRLPNSHRWQAIVQPLLGFSAVV